MMRFAYGYACGMMTGAIISLIMALAYAWWS